MKIVWDEPKRHANIAKHGIDFADIGVDFFLSALVIPARDGRYAAIGQMNGVIAVIFGAGQRGPVDCLRSSGQPQGKGPAAMTKTRYTQTDLDSVADNPEWTPDDFARAVPFDQAFPDLAAQARRARGPQKRPTKVSTTIRLSREVIDHFRTGGGKWQSRIDQALKDWIASH